PLRDRAGPDDLAGGLVQGDYRRLRPTGRADELVAVHQWVIGIAKLRPLGLEILDVILSPVHLAVSCPKTEQLAIGPEGVDSVAVHRRRALEEPAHPRYFTDCLSEFR